ncbi:MAG: HvfB family MNIO-type RiPP peptide maturase [Anaerolineae bacterium]
MPVHDLHGAGLGLRREHLPDLMAGVPDAIDFLELAPENWLDMGGSRRKALRHIAERRPIVAHGLSLNLGGPAPLDEIFLKRVKRFLDEYRIDLFTEHLSWCADDGHLYDLLPIPFTADAVRHVASRIRRAQDILERPIAIENASYYVAPAIAEMGEIDFIRAVLEEADCGLHLDVNNVYVNSVNFAFDPYAFIDAIPAERVVYLHMAGHYQEAEDLIIDTHGADVIEPVWELLAYTYARIGSRPTLLERDFNIPPLAALLPEVGRIRAVQRQAMELRHVA